MRRHRRLGATGLSAPSSPTSQQALEQAVREDWGRLLSLLVAAFRRLDLAEDALADAVEAAARTWPRDGTPERPAAWLLTAARRRAVDRLRAEAVAARHRPGLIVDAEISQDAEEAMSDPQRTDPGEVADERLRLVLLCAHPSLDRPLAAALTLRLVLGVATADIARLFLVPTPTMAARLTRARKRLAGATFEVPQGRDLAARVTVVADVAYLAFTAGYAPASGPDVVRVDLAAEGVRLVRVLRDVLPRDVLPLDVERAELDALLALVLLQHARRDARVRDGRLVLLPDQDRSRWRHDEIAEALALLTPLTPAPAAPYLLQALVAAEHAIAPRAEDTAWERIVARYDELLGLVDTPVVRLNRAVAVAEACGPEAGLAALQGLDLPGHRLPAVRARLLSLAGRPEPAVAAYDQALAACDHGPERALLLERRAELLGVSPPPPPG